jgi:hypothetical protein
MTLIKDLVDYESQYPEEMIFKDKMLYFLTIFRMHSVEPFRLDTLQVLHF